MTEQERNKLQIVYSTLELNIRSMKELINNSHDPIFIDYCNEKIDAYLYGQETISKIFGRELYDRTIGSQTQA